MAQNISPRRRHEKLPLQRGVPQAVRGHVDSTLHRLVRREKQRRVLRDHRGGLCDVDVCDGDLAAGVAVGDLAVREGQPEPCGNRGRRRSELERARLKHPGLGARIASAGLASGGVAVTVCNFLPAVRDLCPQSNLSKQSTKTRIFIL